MTVDPAFVGLHNVVHFAIAVVLWAMGLYLLRHDCTCERCGHCQREKQDREEKRRRDSHDYYHRAFGEDTCTVCHPKDPPRPQG